MKFLLLISFVFVLNNCISQTRPSVWTADNGNGTYKNPILHADYSDPDAIRVGDDFYMISSSFNAAPGLPILHSKDLVNWAIIGHALPRQFPEKDFSNVQHGNGVWAPSIRHHNGWFYIYFPDPDQGIFLTKAKNITGPWTTPVMVEAGKGLIDPCPLWDTNGKAYLVHAFAGSRAGFKSIIVVKEMNAAGDSTISSGVMVYDGHGIDATIEGPKFHKRNGYYYIFAPAGGVSTGWQLVLRSKNVYGPYERKVVMDQGSSPVNGPHQGAWVNTASGQDWFLHFQDKDAYGRVVHLQPMVWKNDWPVIGIDKDGDGKGEPVMIFKKPAVAKTFPVVVPETSDEFSNTSLGLQWQWQANPQSGWGFPTPHGSFRLFCIRPTDSLINYWMLGNMLTQKIPAEVCDATAKLQFTPNNINDRVGLAIFGLDYAFVSIVKKTDGNYLTFNTCKAADKNSKEQEQSLIKWNAKDLYLRISVAPGAICSFSYSADGRSFEKLPGTFTARPGKWVGAKFGLFATSTVKTNDAGFADLDWFRLSTNE
jgi:beta-xylosidase